MAARAERVHERNAERLAASFTRFRGVFIKLGQVLSVLGVFLPPAYGRKLERLQDKVPGRPFKEVEGRLKEAFGENPLDRFDEFEREPIAAASLAQVHRAKSQGRIVAVKILYPGIERLIRSDLGVIRTMAPVLQKLLGLPYLGTVLKQLTEMLEHETDYANECRNMARLRALFADRDDVVVPDVIEELTNAGVLTMTFQEGDKITDLDALVEHDVSTEAVAKLIVECYFSMLWKESVFHADPHPGNFLVKPGPTLVILDYGAVEDVSDDLAEGMKMVVMGALMKNDEQILLGVERMGFVAEDGDREMLAEVGREYLKVLGGVKISDFSQMDAKTVRQLSGYDQARGRLREIMSHINYPEGFFYVERTLVLLFGLVGKLAPKGGLPGMIAPLAMKSFMGG